ncbi:hypothetical protein DPEC_G00227910 [Dallia pectoralis]|uniref:Uncharacterized protein n=1 Tax=Dallia pectoralis TaxID=75939 RepID=A0ACC2G1D5_DALPE|nr:hypothetical protein DPEC_G00227910 [Dallia pectoralis]
MFPLLELTSPRSVSLPQPWTFPTTHAHVKQRTKPPSSWSSFLLSFIRGEPTEPHIVLSGGIRFLPGYRGPRAGRANKHESVVSAHQHMCRYSPIILSPRSTGASRP